MLRCSLLILVLVFCISCQSWGRFWEIPIDVCSLSRLEVIQPSNWSAVQSYLQTEARKGTTGDPVITTVPGPVATNPYSGGVLAANGKIYANPLFAPAYMDINPATDSFTTFGTAPGLGAHTGGTLAANGKIYWSPYTPIGGVPRILQPPSTITLSTGATNTTTSAILGLTISPQGFIYGIPHYEPGILKIDPNTDSHSYFGSFAGVGKWAGAFLAPNGKIYAPPANTTTVLQIDPANDGVSEFGSFPATPGKWIGGAMGNNGKYYAAPGAGVGILEIDPVAQATQVFPAIATVALDYFGGVYAPNGKIYFIPYAAKPVLEFDPATRQVRTFSPATGGWAGGVLAANGKIYGIPNATNNPILIIDTKSVGSLCAPVIESGYFNKF